MPNGELEEILDVITVDEFKQRMSGYVKDIKREIGKLTPQNEPSGPNAQMITTAGQNAEKGITTIIDGVMLMNKGDYMGGGAALIEGVGYASGQDCGLHVPVLGLT
jgi:hypothetical protein